LLRVLSNHDNYHLGLHQVNRRPLLHQAQPTMSGTPPQNPQAPPMASPESLAVANFLKGNPGLKSRTCILQGQRKDLFKVKRALRLLQSDEYRAARAKHPELPEVDSVQSAVIAFSLLPRHLLALRVNKLPQPADKKRIKGQWNVSVESQQEIRDELYYAFFYEPRTWTQTFMAVGLVVALLMVVMFPLWPPMLRLGVWYLSMGCLGLIGLFFVMSVFRLILFLVTCVAVPPGLWLYPNLFEDVGFFDSFRPLWAWHKVKKGKKERKGSEVGSANDGKSPAAASPPPVSVSVASPPKPTVEEEAD